jgi:hypothetical protein
MCGVQSESKGEGQPQKLRQAPVDYMSVRRMAVNNGQNKGDFLVWRTSSGMSPSK